MQVFISWSGDRSRAVAELLDEWIQCVLQAVRPWISSKDIERGSLWFSEISDQLKGTKIGIVCLTKNNLNKPRILFESGALAKGLSSSRVCTFLIDLEPADVSNPLAQFNHTMPDREGLYNLVRTINSSLGENSLREKVFEQVFDTYWPQFEEGFKEALEKNPETENIPVRTGDDILHEILNTTRLLDKKLRSVEDDVPNRKDILRTNPKLKSSIKREIRRAIRNDTPVNVVVEMFSGMMPVEDIYRYIRLAGNKSETVNNSSKTLLETPMPMDLMTTK